MVLLMWYNSLILSGGGSLELSITTGELPRLGVDLLNLGKGPMEPLRWGKTGLNKRLVGFLGRGDIYGSLSNL